MVTEATTTVEVTEAAEVVGKKLKRLLSRFFYVFISLTISLEIIFYIKN